MLYAFKRDIGVVPSPTVHGLWATTLGHHYVQAHAAYSEGKLIGWNEIFKAWDLDWGQACSKHQVSVAEGQQLRGRGARYLKQLWDSLDNVTVLGHNYPCQRRIGDYLIGGSVSVLRALEDKDRGKSGRTIQIIFVDDASTHAASPAEANRRLDYVFAFYGLSIELRNSYRKLADKVQTMVYLSRIPNLVEYKVDQWGVRHAGRWVGNVLKAMKSGIYYPRTSRRCSYCEYRDLCDVSNIRS